MTSAASGSRTEGRTAAVLVVSTRAAAGVYADETGPIIRDWLEARGFATGDPVVVPDAAVAEALASALAGSPDVLLTTGGTGLSPDDRTPEATAALLDREIPGLMEELRRRGLAATPMALLTRGVAGVAGRTVVMNLPGSRGGVRDGLAVLDPILDHLLGQLSGRRDH
ncbi:MogA/MoaB family molybdenum cofactor biosynthesis protein [Microbacterium azadirachtae]|uniref:MogA/MoaB family molybdenum cofactor biosynthesis protein n=1 Tax=Microbacterium azadirachtae TaxID=582680 RepID=UPI000889F9DB|nr:MogA/MoaB family molybdenum cofactor biosynthesis protein [Microbacterium azadirachtae]SDL57626.1 molybdenum cofactor synthesis domain-containing protein [Microbacterium azadirachtae]SEF86432.1 molybdenum cofactor synthesis domain-containing protein [Microbacterium azadirachtae]SEF88309.1 molybdenum cofactor synthesis domain-containing protein [Microbacterium azadirachtae]